MPWLDDAVRDLRERHLLRTPVRITPLGPTHATVGERTVSVFCGNDYLGLRFHPRVLEASRRGLELGAGTGASRLVSGNLTVHEDAERAFAAFVGTEAALLATSGFAANTGTLQAVAGEGDIIFSDSLNHASIVDGCRLSRARTVVFPHADVDELARLVTETRSYRRRWLVTESLFSMDGDLGPLSAYADLCAREDIHLYVDDAHAIGVLGPEGRGACAALSIRPDVLVGTLGKALGTAGAFVAGSNTLRTYLWTRCRSHVFTTGLPPATAAAAAEAIQLVATEPSLRQRLRTNISRLRMRLADIGISATSHPEAPIIPFVVGDERRAVELSRELLEASYFVQAIRPPTVPPGTARLRITVSAAHTDTQIDGLVDALGRLLRR